MMHKTAMTVRSNLYRAETAVEQIMLQRPERKYHRASHAALKAREGPRVSYVASEPETGLLDDAYVLALWLTADGVDEILIERHGIE